MKNLRHDHKSEFEDDGRSIADMSGIKRNPLLIPDINALRRENGADDAEAEYMQDQPDQHYMYAQDQVDSETRRIMIGGALSAGLLIGLVFAAAIAGLIFLINVIGK